MVPVGARPRVQAGQADAVCADGKLADRGWRGTASGRGLRVQAAGVAGMVGEYSLTVPRSASLAGLIIRIHQRPKPASSADSISQPHQ